MFRNDSLALPPGALVGFVELPDLQARALRLSGLQDSQAYTLCLAAEDRTSFRNRQAGARALPFATLDRTPPQLEADVERAPDGADLACAR
jgi:hypothetical protein